MASTYPSVTAKAKKGMLKPWKGPGTVPELSDETVESASDAMMGFLSPQDAAKIALARLPVRFRFKPDPLALLKAAPKLDPSELITVSPGESSNELPAAYWSIADSCGVETAQLRYWSEAPANCRKGINLKSHSEATWPPVASTTTAAFLYGNVYVYSATHDLQWRAKAATRLAGAPVPTPTTSASPATAFAPSVFPMEWPYAMPHTAPIARPMVEPGKVPWTKPLPGEEPAADPQPEPQPDPATDPATKPLTKPATPFPGFVAPFVLPNPGLPLIKVAPGQALPFDPVLPGVVIQPDPSTGDLVAQPSPDFGKPHPPHVSGGPFGGGNKGANRPKEKKAKLSVGMGLVWGGINSVTEAFDFVVAMHESLPKDLRLSAKASKRMVITHMMSNPSLWSHIDLAEGLENFINMQIGDMAAALGSRSIKKVYKDTGMATGLDKSIRDHGNRLGDADPTSHDNWTDIIPTLDIDQENGVVSITGPLGVLSIRKKSFSRR